MRYCWHVNQCKTPGPNLGTGSETLKWRSHPCPVPGSHPRRSAVTSRRFFNYQLHFFCCNPQLTLNTVCAQLSPFTRTFLEKRSRIQCLYSFKVFKNAFYATTCSGKYDSPKNHPNPCDIILITYDIRLFQLHFCDPSQCTHVMCDRTRIKS